MSPRSSTLSNRASTLLLTIGLVARFTLAVLLWLGAGITIVVGWILMRLGKLCEWLAHRMQDAVERLVRK